MEEESSSGESFYSAGGDSESADTDGPVSSRTRSRHGGLLAVVDAVPPDPRRHVWGSQPCQPVSHYRPRGTGQVRQNSHSVEREGLPQHKVTSHPRPLRRVLLEAEGSPGRQKDLFSLPGDDLSHYSSSSVESVRYRRGLAALVRRHDNDWRYAQRVRQEAGKQKRQLVIGAALGTVFRGVLWNDISDWVRYATPQ